MLAAQQPTQKLSLSEEEFLKIHQIIKDAPPRISILNLRYQIWNTISRLRSFDIKEIQIEYRKYELIYWPQPSNLFEHFKSVRDSLLRMGQDPIHYLWTNENPLFIKRKGKWTKDEVELLQNIFKNAKDKPNFSLLSLCFPGRTGQQIYNEFSKLISQNQITDALKLPKKGLALIDPLLAQTFLPCSERILAKDLTDLALKGIQVTNDVIQSRARTLYKMPWILAERAVYQLFSLNQKSIYIGKEKYNDEFIEKCRELETIVERIFNDDDDDAVIDQNFRNFLKEYSLKNPSFSEFWIKSFSKRNRFSWRIAHYARRGSIDIEYAKKYVKLVASAISLYGEDLVFNMDETSVRINNGSTRSLAPIGWEEIIVDAKRNSKECFTVIGTCSLIKKMPLIILTKGTTDASTTKFRAGDETEVWPTGNQQGWMNEEMMVKYLYHLHEKFAETYPCALILDCYRAHRTDLVKDVARNLGIKLIYVPANGTGKYQPLDRRIFGILKAKLRSLAKSNIYADEERFATITNHLVLAWNQITQGNLLSAWSIPGLPEAYKLIENKEKGGDIINLLENENDAEIYYEEEDVDDLIESDSSDEEYR